MNIGPTFGPDSELAPLSPARAGWRGGIGVLGDSYSDEYQFYPPHRSTARNWVEILAATRGLNFGRFSTRSRGEPRNRGYEYNWARSDATTDDLIAIGVPPLSEREVFEFSETHDRAATKSAVESAAGGSHSPDPTRARWDEARPRRCRGGLLWTPGRER